MSKRAKRILRLFCGVDSKPNDSVYGKDTELFEHEREAIEVIDKILKKESESCRRLGAKQELESLLRFGKKSSACTASELLVELEEKIKKRLKELNKK